MDVIIIKGMVYMQYENHFIISITINSISGYFVGFYQCAIV